MRKINIKPKKKRGFLKAMKSISLLMLILWSSSAMAKTVQSVLETKVTVEARNESIENLLKKIEEKSKVTFVYSTSKVTLSQILNRSYINETIGNILLDILPKNIGYGVSENRIVLKKRKVIKKAPFIQQSGTVSGVLKDGLGNILPYASVLVKGTSKGATSDLDGRFSIELLPGSYTLMVQYMGYDNKEVEVTVEAGATATVEIVMSENVKALDETIVYGTLTRGQARALNQQKISNNIKNVVEAEQFLRYPDVSAAEIVQRLPGISINRDQGEGEFVTVRGVSEQLNSLTINGERMPAVEADGRAVGLDLVQSFLIDKITVTKSLTADMDGDAIGGSVDFQMREARGDQEVILYTGYGYNSQETEYENFGKDILSFQGLVAQRFFENQLGVLVAGSYFNTDRGSIFNSRRFVSLENNELSRRRTTDYDVKRIRYGGVVNIDFKPDNSNKWILTGNYNRYKDDEVRQQTRYTWNNNREERRTRNRLEDQTLFFAKLTGEHSIGKTKFDYSGSFGTGSEDIPDRTEWRYRRTVEALSDLSRSELDNLSANSTFGDSDPLEFNSVEFEPQFTEEDNMNLSSNFLFPITSNEKSTIKIGVKYRSLNRKSRLAGVEPELLDGLTIQTFAEGQFPFPELTFTDSEFASLGFDTTPSNLDLEAALVGYEASEDVFAGYVMNTTQWGEHLTSVTGVRLETTSTDYSATDNDLTGKGSYSNVLPSVNLTYRLDDKNQLRAAYYSAISRPSYTSLVPFETIGNDEINRGNEDLEALTSSNFDIVFERYTDNLGLFSVGVFAKSIKNQIIEDQVGTEDGLPVFTLVNGGKASVYGFELAYNQSLVKLINFPLSLNANYTFTESESDFGDDRDDLPFANSPKHTGNLSLLFDDEKSGFSGVLAGVYRHFMFNKFENTDAAVDGNEEIWLDRTFHLDLSLAYKFNKNVTAKLQVNNLTNQANQEITGKPSERFSKWSETESYGPWGVFGFEFRF